MYYPKEPIIFDNFLEEEYFNKLKNMVCSTNYSFPWFYGPYYIGSEDWKEEVTAGKTFDEDDPLSNFFTHYFYNKNIPQSPFYEVMLEFLKTLNQNTDFKMNSLVRMRANYFQNYRDGIIHEYDMHTDASFSHTSAILSLNTCDGYTGIENKDGTITKIPSVANQVLLFDAGKRHCSSTTTDAKARFNIIVNYL
jgi:hypothetical protein